MSDLLFSFAREPLCHQPTPLEPMRRLSAHAGGPDLWIKRDDCTGLATGGNKTRKLEFLMGEALRQKADIVVTQGAVQSNHVRQTAAAACRLGMKSYALLERRVSGKDASYEQTGNVFFDHMFGTEIEFRPSGLDMNAEAMAVCERLRKAGHNPYFIPGGGSNEIGALGYVSCAEELLAQIKAMALNVQALVVATGSTGTQAGLVAGFHALGSTIPIIGISVRQPKDKQTQAVHKLAVKTAAQLTDKAVSRDRVIVYDGYVGPGYGVPTQGTVDATSLVARTEGILLDLVYSAKGMAGLLDLIKQGILTDKGDVIFLHTGGSVSLFAYEDSFLPQQAAE